MKGECPTCERYLKIIEQQSRTVFNLLTDPNIFSSIRQYLKTAPEVPLTLAEAVRASQCTEQSLPDTLGNSNSS